MKTAGIIAEYNPFHNGHRYHIARTKAESGADYVVAAMSGDFVQRGAPAIIGKFERARMALENGVDLVIELPVRYSLGSAGYFATGAVGLLHSLGIIDVLSFGSESQDLLSLQNISNILEEEPLPYHSRLLAFQRQGLSYPAARQRALQEYLGSTALPALWPNPNDILAIAYLRALRRQNSSIRPLAIRRAGGGYHQSRLTGPLSSAAAIRQMFQSHAGNGVPFGDDRLRSALPDNVFHFLENSWQKTFPLLQEDFSLLYQYQLLSEKEKGFEQYLDVTKDLSHKISNTLSKFETVETYVRLLKTKDLTQAKIQRALLHILLGIKDYAIEDTPPAYIRILGFRKDSGPLLSLLKKRAALPLIAKPADARKLLGKKSHEMFQEDIYASSIYQSVLSHKFHTPARNEYRRGIVIL